MAYSKGQPQRGSAAETLARLRQAGVPADALSSAIASMRVELVFTAHPTEIVRRTLLQKHNRIAQILAPLPAHGQRGLRRPALIANLPVERVLHFAQLGRAAIGDLPAGGAREQN